MSYSRDSKSSFRLPFILLVLVALVVAALAALHPGGEPEIEVSADRVGVGRSQPTTVDVRVDGPFRGLGAIRVEALQEGMEPVVLAERGATAQPLWAFWEDRETEDEFQVEVGRDSLPELTSGEVTVRVTAERPGALVRAGEPTVEDLVLPVRLTPPTLSVLSSQHYVTQGGSGVVVYSVGDSARMDGARHGVQTGDWFFPGRPTESGNEFFSLFGIPYDLGDSSKIRLIAEDDLGNQATATFVTRFFPRPLPEDDIQLSDAFLQKVVPEILGQAPEIREKGDLLEDYLQLNGDLRQKNAATLKDLADTSPDQFLWSGAFEQLPNSQVTSNFADRRTYFYNGEVVDEQDHLGYDLASNAGAPVPASNAGRVALARYFGIYGNTVVLDHGYGLMTLYSHLSSIGVEEGDEVAQGEVIGRTGETGLAGGDHLHFTFLLRGLAVNPREWLDPAWIRDRITSKMPAAAPTPSSDDAESPEVEEG